MRKGDEDNKKKRRNLIVNLILKSGFDFLNFFCVKPSGLLYAFGVIVQWPEVTRNSINSGISRLCSLSGLSSGHGNEMRKAIYNNKWWVACM